MVVALVQRKDSCVKLMMNFSFFQYDKRHALFQCTKAVLKVSFAPPHKIIGVFQEVRILSFCIDEALEKVNNGREI